MTPFLMAVAANRLDVARLLVAEQSANTKAMASRSLSALHIASCGDGLLTMRYLVEEYGLDVHLKR